MKKVAHPKAKRPSKTTSSASTKPETAANQQSWVRARRADDESPVWKNETLGGAIRRQVAWLSLVLQQKIEQHGKEVGGSGDIEEVIVRMLDISLEADGIEADFERLHAQEVQPTATARPPMKAIEADTGMKTRQRWLYEWTGEDSESFGEAMRRQVSAVAAIYQQNVRERGIGSGDSAIESGFARLMALSLEIDA